MDKEELENLNKKVTIAGRMVSKRGKGKVGFADFLPQWPRASLFT
jgi:lysyl-tRNA synthetase class 2